MSEKNELDKEANMVFDKIYQAEVATNNLKYHLELRISKTRIEYERHYKGKELKKVLTHLDALRGERLNTIEEAGTDIQVEIIKTYVKKEMEK